MKCINCVYLETRRSQGLVALPQEVAAVCQRTVEVVSQRSPYAERRCEAFRGKPMEIYDHRDHHLPLT